MADVKKYRLSLRGHSEDVSEQELESVKKMAGTRFAEYDVTPLQPDTPADVAPPKPKAAHAEPKA